MGLAKFFLIPSSGVLAIPISLMSLNTEIDDEIVLATYQSYINSDIADQAFNDYSLKTIYFETDKEVFNGFASGAFNLAILSSSTLEEAISKNLAKKIDWRKFSSIKGQLGENGGGNGQEKINEKLGKLYSPVVNKFFKNAPELAEYGVPYFISYFAFAYRGKPLEENGSTVTTVSHTSSTTSETSPKTPMTWHDLMQKISKDKRFHSKDGEPKLGMVEDELTLFSLSKLSGKNTEKEKVEELFKKEEKTSEDDFYRQYMQINEAGINKNILGERPLFFSPDSVVLSTALSSGDLEGIFFYNGDALYAHQLLEEEKSKNTEETTSQEIHIVPLSPALWFLDSIVISSKSSPSKEARIYEFLEKLSFKNFDKLSELDRQEELGGDSEDKEEGDKERPQWLLGNFMEIGYTPVLQDFNKWIKGEKPPKSPPEPPEGEGDFYKKEKEFLYGNPDIEKCLAQQPPNNGQQCSIVFEGGLNDSQNLNLALAFERWKNNF